VQANPLTPLRAIELATRPPAFLDPPSRGLIACTEENGQGRALCVLGASTGTDAAGLGICRKNAQTKEAIRPNKANPYSPPAKLPVASFITPTYQGPKKPPRLPSELIHAIEAAAAVPVRNIGGMAQNGPYDP
jgi:hypothetical protein